MKSLLSGAVAGALLLCSAAVLADNESVPMDELHQCREYPDIEKRLACYDGIGETAPVVATTGIAVQVEPQETEAVAAEVSQEVDDDSQYRELTDDIGLPKSEDNYETILTTVVRCGVANNRKFYFYFENGQVWQYLGNKKLRYRNCNAQAKLVEDGIGFKLQLDGESGQPRVKRVK
ncbi:MAG: hypothetical protein OER22_05305 [Gammaproteobacteria bacterium]|nr:hypothetical protein [Gammaproteobacteria bacterium]MDH3372928.1 hypothetical protein [Gammaproteobacteria bacterium]MDH3409573.1 hypothetical protein [Gammaproteobacteria bacterium]MDH3552014.1 hypothetical protein [Gammaproteobacteria bacterium]